MNWKFCLHEQNFNMFVSQIYKTKIQTTVGGKLFYGGCYYLKCISKVLMTAEHSKLADCNHSKFWD